MPAVLDSQLTEQPVDRPRRLNSLTGLRFLAAIGVVLVHVTFQFASAPTLTTAAGYGYIGVTFFFLLSGFVLTWSYIGQSATRFWWLRLARIWPLHMAVMLAAFVLLAEQVNMPGPFGQAADLLLLQAWVPDRTVYFGGNGVSWSLSCEMFFYLLFPLVILIVNKLRARGVLLAAGSTFALLLAAPLVAGIGDPLTEGGLVSARTYYWLFYIFPPYRFGEFFLGMLLARAVVLGLRIRWPALAWLIAATGLTVLLVVLTQFTVHTGVWIAKPLVNLAAAPFFAMLILSNTTVELRSNAAVRRNGWLLLRLGEWSFALYLLHKPFFLLTQKWGWWENIGGLQGLAYLIAFLVSATLAAAMAHRLLERPVEAFLRGLPVAGTLGYDSRNRVQQTRT